MKEETLKQLISAEEKEKIGKNIPLGETPLWQYWEEFVSAYLEEGRSIVTVTKVRDTIKFIIKRIGFYTIEKCNNKKRFYDMLLKAKKYFKWSNVTVNSYRKNLSTYFRWLEDMEYIESNEVAKVRKSKEEINEQYTLEQSQINLLRAHLLKRRQTRLERWRNVFFMDLMTFTGARPCELLQLQCRDVEKRADSYKLILRGRKQKGRRRYYALPSNIRDSYEMYMKIRQDVGREELNLFVSQSKRTGWTNKGLQGLCKNLSKELGFRVISYGIRRFVATKLYLQGLSLEKIADYLGHTRTSTTKKYIARQCALTKECGEVMTNILFEKSKRELEAENEENEENEDLG